MSKKLTKEEALHFITTWRDSLDEPRVEDGYWHDVSDDLHNYFEATGARDCHDVSGRPWRLDLAEGQAGRSSGLFDSSGVGIHCG